MGPLAVRCAIAGAVALLACSRDAAAPSPQAQDDAGAAGCNPGELTLDDGTCQPAGIPPGMCGSGFAADGNMGCDPILPSKPCAKGQMAVPGETQCRDVAPCADGTWGDIPVESSTQFVDASYAGGGSDGSQGKPWTTIGDAVKAAAPAAIVAIAAGSYREDVAVAGKAVRLRGRCPKLVEIVGSATAPAGAVTISGPEATGTEIRELAIRGAGEGIDLSGSENVAIDRVWVHDTADRGLVVYDAPGATSVLLSRSLVEATRDLGVFVTGCDATIDASVVRGTRPRDDLTSGNGICAQDDVSTSARAHLKVQSSVIEQNRELGVFVTGSDATLETSVVRDTQPQAADRGWGDGILIQESPDTHARARVTVRASILDRNRAVGLFALGSDATLEATAVRDMQPVESTQTGGLGVYVTDSPATHARSTLAVRASLVERARATAVRTAGSDATIEATAVRDTQPQASDRTLGLGLVFEDDAATHSRTIATVRGCVVERSRMMGVVAAGSEVAIEGTAVRDTQHQAIDGAFGDGVVAWRSAEQNADARLAASRVERSARAGISSFGAHASLTATTLDCNAIDLDGENAVGFAYDFDLSGGGNVCGCGDASVECQVLSSGLAPPASIGGIADAGPTLSCPPVDTSSYHPPQFAPSKADQGQCTAGDVAAFVAACGDKGAQAPCDSWLQSNTASDASAGTACGNCIFAPDNSGGAWTDPQGYFSPNIAGCIQLTDAKHGAACGAAWDAYVGCVRDACDQCVSQADFVACSQAASGRGCQSYTSAFGAACATDLADGGAEQTCTPGGSSGADAMWTYIVMLICGGGDGGVSDAGLDAPG